MWAAILEFALGIVKWLFGGRQQTEGEAQGQAEQAKADTNQELVNVAKADDARNSVRDSASDIVSDGANSGPAR